MSQGTAMPSILMNSDPEIVKVRGLNPRALAYIDVTMPFESTVRLPCYGGI